MNKKASTYVGRFLCVALSGLVLFGCARVLDASGQVEIAQAALYSEAIGKDKNGSKEDHARRVKAVMTERLKGDAGGLNFATRAMAEGVLGDWKAAAVDLTSALEKRPDCVYWYRMRGVANRESGNFKQAAADFTHAMDLNPKLELLSERADVRVKAKDYENALKDYDAAIKGTRYIAYYEREARADLLVQMGRKKDAVAGYQSLIEEIKKQAEVDQLIQEAARKNGETPVSNSLSDERLTRLAAKLDSAKSAH